ncbi:hypothetical protein IFM89_035118 [Coptis chinensis]|uniref:Glutamyl-tRNA reductase N-terminal domain-containing protein n=1 Tax=Coptis chinensis TaxID=261450 RepID=A0A835M869_9MAGN|nr:hypothetical protein IFM89_035118 [Coptis chinensis]
MATSTATGFATSMAAVKTMMESSYSNSSQFRIICKPKRTFLVRRGGVTRCEAVSDNNNNRVSSLSALEQLKASGADRYTKKESIIVLGLSIHTTPVEMREKLGIPDSSWHRGVRELTEWMAKTSGIPASELRHHLFMLRDGDATQHLFEVSAGLDSLVLGEGQILAQVKQVIMSGEGVNGFGRNISGLFKHAITVGKRVRTETNIASGAVSVSSAAIELVLIPQNSSATARVLVVGERWGNFNTQRGGDKKI